MSAPVQNPQAETLTRLGNPTSPYRGIESFRLVDRAIFRARDQDVRKVFRLITIYRAVLLSGDSGVGKSSLLNAGLIPQLLDDGSWVERFRVRPIPGEEFLLKPISLGDDNTAPYLPSLFADERFDAEIPLSAEAFVGKLRAAFPKEKPADRPPVVLLVDQFEESVTLFEEAPDNRDAFERAHCSQQRMFDAIKELITDEDLPVKLLFALRDDYLAKVIRHFSPFHPQIKDQEYHLSELTQGDLTAIVRGPYDSAAASSFSRQLKPETCRLLEDGLRARSENGLITLTETQIACRTLCDESTEEEIFLRNAAEKGPAAAIDHIFNQHMELAMRSLSPATREHATLVLTKLITSSNTRNIVSRSDLLDALDRDGVSHEEADQALEALCSQAKLVYRQARGDTPFYEIVSESLIPWIQSQRARLTELRQKEQAEDERRERLRHLEQIEQAKKSAAEEADQRAGLAKLAEEQAKGREATMRNRARQAARVAGVVGLALAMALVFAISAGWKLEREKERSKKELANILQQIEKERTDAKQLATQNSELAARLENANEVNATLRAKVDESITQRVELNASFNDLEAQKNKLLDDKLSAPDKQAAAESLKKAYERAKVSAERLERAQQQVVQTSEKYANYNWQRGNVRVPAVRELAARKDGLALFDTWEQARLSRVFQPQPPGLATPAVAQLNPKAFWISTRWNYSVTPKDWLRATKARVRNPVTGAIELAQPVDWGPSETTGAIMDISPGLAAKLGLKHGDQAAFCIDEPKRAK